MPTVPLYDSVPVVPDAGHAVAAPGGYEWWYFDAEDVERDIQVVAILFDGFVFHPEYLRRYFAYRRRPTRVAPPLPREYPCAYLAVYRGGRLLSQLMTQYAAGSLEALADGTVRLGPCGIDRLGGGVIDVKVKGTPWKLSPRGPRRLEGQTLSADLRFTPQIDHPPQERVFLSQQLSGAEHHWIIANPMCAVAGEIAVPGETIRFAGRGYHDHNYGTAPLGPGLKRWIWGRVLFEDVAYTFHYARANEAALPDEVHLIEASAGGVRELHVDATTADWSGLTLQMLQYPRAVRFSDRLELSRPRVIDSSPFYMRLMYDAKCDGRIGNAFCEVAYPNRLRWPVLGRMIEMSIDQPTA